MADPSPPAAWHRRGLFLALLFWAAFCLALWWPTLAPYASSSALMHALGQGSLIIYVHLTFCALLLLALRQRPRTRAWALAAYWALSFLGLLAAAGKPGPALAATAAAAWVWTGGFGLSALSRRYRGWALPPWAGVLLFLVLLEACMLVLGAAGVANLGLKAAAGGLLTAVAVAGLLAGRPAKPGKYFDGLAGLNATGLIFAEGILLLAGLAFLHAATPETLVDSTALHMLKARALARSASLSVLADFPYNPFYLLPSYVHLIFGFFYSMIGDWGVKGLTWGLLPAGVWMVREIGRAHV